MSTGIPFGIVDAILSAALMEVSHCSSTCSGIGATCRLYVIVGIILALMAYIRIGSEALDILIHSNNSPSFFPSLAVSEFHELHNFEDCNVQLASAARACGIAAAHRRAPPAAPCAPASQGARRGQPWRHG